MCAGRAAEADYSAARAQQLAAVLQQRASTRAQAAAVSAQRPAAYLSPSSTQMARWAQAVSDIPCIVPPAGETGDIVDDGARRTGLDTNLVRAVVRKESAYNPCATSTKGAQGLMQLMPSVQIQFG